MVIPLVLFGLAAVGGLILATQRFKGAPQPSLPLAVIHGSAAALGLITLAVAVLGTGAPAAAKGALVVFLIAALGGFYLIAQHLQKKPLPIPVIVVHALVAVTGFVILLVAALGVT